MDTIKILLGMTVALLLGALAIARRVRFGPRMVSIRPT